MTTLACPYCKASIQSDASRCPHCRAHLSKTAMLAKGIGGLCFAGVLAMVAFACFKVFASL